MIYPPSPKQQRALLTRQFMNRFFNSELVPRHAEARVTLIQILSLAAVPGFVVMVALLRKHARLLSLPAEAAQIAALNEKCLFVYFSMVVIGFLAVLEWDTLFPDRRDYLILSPLPIEGKTLFIAKAGALCLFLMLFSVFVNLFPTVMYPMFARRGFLQSIRFILGHALSVFAANTFMFFACITIQGVLLNIFGPRLSRPISRFVQLLLLVLLLSTFFIMPSVSYESLRQNPGFLAVFAPAWFLGLYETLLGGADPEFHRLAARALAALGLTSFGFVLSYILAYRRHLRMILEGGRAGCRNSSRMMELFPALFHRVLFRGTAERASFCFIIKTLARSHIHRTYLGGYLGVGLAFVVMGLVTMFTRHGFGAVYGVRPELLSIPMVLTFFLLLGLRVIFSFPANLHANWAFRLADGNNVGGHLSGIRKVMFVVGVLPVLATVIPFYLRFWGWSITGIHVAYCTVLSIILIEILLWRLDRIPFTCSYMPGNANLKLWWLAYLLAFANYAYTTTELELELLHKPMHFIPFFVVALSTLATMLMYRRRRIASVPALQYDGDTAQDVAPLTLSYKPFQT